MRRCIRGWFSFLLFHFLLDLYVRNVYNDEEIEEEG